MQPRRSGQILIGSSRQYGAEHKEVDQAILDAHAARAHGNICRGLARCRPARAWTGFRAATADKLPLIGPWPGDDSLFLATGHEGLGITTSLATARILVDQITGATARDSGRAVLAVARGEKSCGGELAMNWKGVMPAITTCFNDDLSIDHGSWRTLPLASG